MTHYITHLDNFTVAKLPEENFPEIIPPLPETSALTTGAISAFLQSCDAVLQKCILHPYAALDLHRLRSAMIDRLITTLAREHLDNSDSFAVVAVGGYGRREMSLYSDIDLLFLHDSPDVSTLKPGVEKILYLLWDAKLDIGHSVRTIKECLDLVHDDHTIFTNLLEARSVCGNNELFQKLEQGVSDKLFNDTIRRKFIDDKLQERDERHAKYGGSVYLLEPNLKEGKGGLRDLHLLRWLIRAEGGMPKFREGHRLGFLSEEESKVLQFSLRFLLQIRNRLHLIKKKKSDQILFDSQALLAKGMGFSDTPGGILAVEQFMQSYYTVASQVKLIGANTIRKILTNNRGTVKSLLDKLTGKSLDENFRILDDQIQARSENLFTKDPYQLMNLFRHVQKTGLEIHYSTKEMVISHLNLVDDAFRSDTKIAALFRVMMADLNNLDRALFAMHEVHFFDAYIPEFRKLRNRVQHDIYHVYTVDTHSIFAISEISKLSRGEYTNKFSHYSTMLSGVSRLDVLSMGLLFHDVGKGEGGNHSVVGAQIAGRVAGRLGYSESDRDTIEFLVLSHLTMPHLSQRRDLEDQHLILEFAKTVKSEDRLNMLTILTWADIRAVSTEAWTDWKGTLLIKLHDKAKALFHADFLSENYAQRRIEDVRAALIKRLGEHSQDAAFENFLKEISPRYLVAHNDEEILEHFRLIREHESDHFFFVEKEFAAGEVSEILIFTFANPRVLALVTGVMLAHGVNILDMEIFTVSRGDILIKLRVQTEGKASLSQNGSTERLEQSLRDVFMGKKLIDDLIAKRQRPSYLIPQGPIRRASAKIDIDNDVSPYFTIIDIYAHDRLGLLYDIIKCLTQQGCYVEVSKISTKVEQVVDSFYVKDIFGHKITSKMKLGEIKKALLQVIEPTDQEKSS